MRKECVPYIIYADLTCILEKMEMDIKIIQLSYQHHQVFSIVYVRCSHSLSTYRFHCGNGCVAWFAEEPRNLAHNVQSILFTYVSMADFTRDNWEKFNSATHCHMREKDALDALDDTWVRDHCHLTGRYRGPVHSSCNINYKDSHFVPVIFQDMTRNLS